MKAQRDTRALLIALVQRALHLPKSKKLSFSRVNLEIDVPRSRPAPQPKLQFNPVVWSVSEEKQKRQAWPNLQRNSVYVHVRAGHEATKNTGPRKLRIAACNERKTLSVFLPRVRARTSAGEPKAELKTLKTRGKIADYVTGPRRGRNYRENEQESRDSSSQLLARAFIFPKSNLVPLAAAFDICQRSARTAFWIFEIRFSIALWAFLSRNWWIERFRL